jgi:hypothetical protein
MMQKGIIFSITILLIAVVVLVFALVR